MRYKRWYATCTRMWDLRVLITLGENRWPQNGIGGRPLRCEAYTPSTDAVAELTNDLPVSLGVTYAHVYCVPTPSGPRMLYAGPEPQAYLWNGTLSSAWASFGTPISSPNGLYASTSVMYAPGKILKIGGSSDGGPTALARMWRLDTVNGTGWTRTNTDLTYARKDANSVMMPDQKVFIVGGKDGTTERLIAEIYDPIADTATTLTPAMDMVRAYHSVAMLLKDARVVVAGGEGASYTFQIFNPPYFSLDQAKRPVLLTPPSSIAVGSTTMTRVTWQPQGGSGHWRAISKVCLISLGAVTHGFDQNQRYVPLSFNVVNQGAIDISPPSDGGHAPPGWYMLFFVTEDGLPSVGAYVQVTPPPP